MIHKKRIVLAAALAAVFSSSAFAVINIGVPATTAGAAGTTVSVPVRVVRGAADAASFAASSYRIQIPASQVSAAPTFTPAAAPPWTGANITGCTFTVQGANQEASCGFATAGPFSNPVIAAGTYQIGTISVPLTAGATFPVAITAIVDECADQAGNKLPAGSCAPTSGTITAAPPNTWTAAAGPLNVGSAPAGGNVSANQVINANAGNTAAGSLASCTFAGANAASFSSTATFPLTLAQTGATNLPIRFAPPGGAPVGAQTATVTCTGGAGTTLAGFPVTLNGTVIAGNSVAVGPATLTFPATAVGGNSATQNVTLTAPAGNTAAVQINACTIGGANAAAFNFSPAFAGVSVAAGATVNVPVRFSPTAATPSPQTASVTCTTSTAGATVTGTSALSGTIAPATVSATTASGTTIALPGQFVGVTPGSATAQFTATGGPATLNCAVTNTGTAAFAVAPAALALVAGTPGSVTITHPATVAGTFAGTLTCTPAAPAAGGPFTYPLTFTVAVAAPQIAVPTLGNFGLLLLIAGFLGLGVFLVNRR